MYHYDPAMALEELSEEAILPDPVHIRDMIIRTRLDPESALDLNRRFHAYMESFQQVRQAAKEILEILGRHETKK